MTIALDNAGNATIDVDTDDILGYDNTEENQDASDMAVLVDEDDRDSSINEESEIPSYQKPWIKLAVLGTVIGGVGLGAASLYTISQSKVSQIATAAKPDEVKGLGFAEGGDADKTAIALNSQNGQFKPSSQESPPASPGQDAKPPTPSPTPSVATAPPITPAPKPSAAPVASAPKVSSPKVNPVASAPSNIETLKPKTIPQSVKPSNDVKPLIPKKVATIPVNKEKPAILDKPSNIIKPAPSKPVDQQIALKTSAKQVQIDRPASVAPVAAAPTTPPLSPEQQWLAMSRSGTFGNAANATGSELKPVEQEVALATPQLQPVTNSTVDGVPTVKIARVNPGIGNGKSVDPVINLRQSQGDLISEAPAPLPNPTTQEEKRVEDKIQPIASDFVTASFKDANKMNMNLGNGGTLVAYNGIKRFRIDTQGDDPQPQQNVPAPAPTNDGILPSEQKIIQGVAIQNYKVPVGTQLKATVLTPVQASALDASGISPVGSIVAVRLDAPLKDPSGKTIIPSENTQIIFTFEVKNGWVIGTSRTLIVNNQKTDIEGLITMQGGGGQPLIAEVYRPGGAEIAAADQNLLLWGAVAGAGEAATQGSTTVTLGNGGTVVQNSGGQNILGGILKGAGTPYVQAQQERAKAASLAAAARQPIYYVTPGAKVDLFIMGQLEINN
jgi:hypothetical protein